jgi:hypothetical protein
MSLVRPGLESRVLSLLPEVLPVIAVMHQNDFLSQLFWQSAEFVNRRVNSAGKQLAVMKNNLKLEAFVIAFDELPVELRI